MLFNNSFLKSKVTMKFVCKLSGVCLRILPHYLYKKMTVDMFSTTLFSGIKIVTTVIVNSFFLGAKMILITYYSFYHPQTAQHQHGKKNQRYKKIGQNYESIPGGLGYDS